MSNFGHTWGLQHIPDLNGMIAVVTGANGGLGLVTARALAGRGAKVVMATRDQAKTNTAVESILDMHPDAHLEVVPLDLSSLDSVKGAASVIRSQNGHVDVLVNNAGVMATPRSTTEDGFEGQIGTNHLGHFYLTALLLDDLLRSPAARVVTVTSFARHFGSAVDDDPHLEGGYTPWKGYGNSKLANYHFAIGLQERIGGSSSFKSIAAPPGLTHTDLQSTTVRHGAGGWLGAISQWGVPKVGMSAAQGALSQLRAATDPQVRGGELYAPRFVYAGPPARWPIFKTASMSRAIDRLWSFSESETGAKIELPSH